MNRALYEAEHCPNGDALFPVEKTETDREHP